MSVSAVLTPTLPTHGASPATDITTPVPMTTQGAIPKQPVTGVKRSMSPNKSMLMLAVSYSLLALNLVCT